MRILLLTHSFNSLTQRLFAELTADGHELSVEFDIADRVAEEAVALFRPDLILAPFLKRAVPESIWSHHLTLIVHPGIVGDRGPSALDWAITNDETEWGVTVLQAEAAMDAGPVWASVRFRMREATKASLYRNEVTAAALQAVRSAIQAVPRWREGQWTPTPLAHILEHAASATNQNAEHNASSSSPAHGSPLRAVFRAEASATRPTRRETAPGGGGLAAPQLTVGIERPLLKQSDRKIDWTHDSTATILQKLRAADGFPGVADALFDTPCHLFDAHPATADEARPATPGVAIARRDGAILRTTVDGAVWIGHVKRADSDHPFKLPATAAFAAEAAELPELQVPLHREASDARWSELRYRESPDGTTGFLAFDFYNGAMATDQCQRLTAAIRFARSRPTRVLVLEGGRDFWSNGIHLNRIEAAASPADESWANINAMNDVCLALLTLTDRLTVAALRGNAGAGGCFLALAADLVWARDGIVMNPHYKNMGNLFGSEYWTYLLPRRVGIDAARRIMGNRLPLLARAARAAGLVDATFSADLATFETEVARHAAALAADPTLAERIAAKTACRATDEAQKPLAAYREEELAAMRRNFYGFDPSYHVARYHFVMKSPQSWTPRHLARHRDLGWRVPGEVEAA
ncbi:putative two-component system protein, hydrogenase maturation factor HypX/HoxX [Aromatoleum tolulyticum]|uniref:Putative two-component system protein, hydrogenase maturation factor HypX/HoxX n=1 Tax=Aromatoleum tolulyticum TaxID=34027 RepID=A0A1N6WE61_9RHOO|nr:hydrogenase maturation protein [Aromatoleum tolulyticum]SIQ88260.1 putative two-component system protein, hydrogenase maturation factor HypX/HoxX [Aromatoleum tolulyticum]